LVINQRSDKNERTGYPVRKIQKKKQFDDEIYDIDKFKPDKVKANKKRN